MSILKDWREDNGGYRLNRQILYFFSPQVWLRLHKYRKQRADRGWADRDTWNAGEHIAQMTAEMLQHLNDNAYIDWPKWFNMNVKEKKGGSYKSLQSIIDDIENYLEFSTTSWGDGLETIRDSLEEIFEKREDGMYEYKSPTWVDKNGKKLTEKQVTARIKKWSKEEDRLYKKATDAMQFFGRHFSSFWD